MSAARAGRRHPVPGRAVHVARHWRGCQALALLLTTLQCACAAAPQPLQPQSQSPTAQVALALAPARGQGQGQGITLQGLLTRKGADTDSWFAITDADGRVWRCTGVSAALAQQLLALQNRRVRVQGRYRGQWLGFGQIEPVRVHAAAN